MNCAPRVMQKMGYLPGQGGLGRDPSRSRVTPVKATMYPRGRSLDWCMELREWAGGEDIFEVKGTSDVFRLRRQQRAKEEEEEEETMSKVVRGHWRERSGRAGNISL